MRNRLLLALPESERSDILGGSAVTEFFSGEPLLDADRPVRRVVFPETMLASQIVTMSDGNMIEVGAIGYEGVVGLTAGIGPAETTWSAVCQIGGEGYAVDAETFRRGAPALPQLELALGAFTHAVVNQMAQAAACNRLHGVEQRAARWLLMSRDRISRDQLRITQEQLAEILGVSRTTLSTVATAFARGGLADFRHGLVTIRDPAGLEQLACECYSVLRHQFAGLTGSPPP